jgi:hypothetical protein
MLGFLDVLWAAGEALNQAARLAFLVWVTGRLIVAWRGQP